MKEKYNFSIPHRQYPLPLHQLAGQGRVQQNIDETAVDGYVFNESTGVRLQWKMRAKAQFECPEGGRIAGEGYCARPHPSCGGDVSCNQEIFYRGRTIVISPEREIANWYFEHCELQPNIAERK